MSSLTRFKLDGIIGMATNALVERTGPSSCYGESLAPIASMATVPVEANDSTILGLLREMASEELYEAGRYFIGKNFEPTDEDVDHVVVATIEHHAQLATRV